LSALQSRILSGAADIVRPGGRLVYATCSLEPEENGRQVEGFLREHPQFVRAPLPSDIPRQYVDSEGHLSITPHEHGLDGMFGAVFQKKR
jgi:16S rRNA (cytosine967-C5)-methyltransferase